MTGVEFWKTKDRRQKTEAGADSPFIPSPNLDTQFDQRGQGGFRVLTEKKVQCQKGNRTEIKTKPASAMDHGSSTVDKKTNQ